jgi:hypothetical protein
MRGWKMEIAFWEGILGEWMAGRGLRGGSWLTGVGSGA